jgi:hypothetical protein
MVEEDVLELKQAKLDRRDLPADFAVREGVALRDDFGH